VRANHCSVSQASAQEQWADKQVPLNKGGKGAAGLGGCLGRFVNRGHDNPRAVSAKPLSPFAKGDFDGALGGETEGNDARIGVGLSEVLARHNRAAIRSSTYNEALSRNRLEVG